MTNLLRWVDAVLRDIVPSAKSPQQLVPVASSRPGLLSLLAVVVVCGLLYGAVMGSSGGVLGERFLQVIFSAIKVPLLLLATFALSLPSFYILNTLLGLRDDFPEVLRAIVMTQAVLTIILASLPPCTLLWYASTLSYPAAILFNAVMFGTASLAAQQRMRRLYLPLIARDPRHRLLLGVWLFVYAFVGIQMGWLLRPFIGMPGESVHFFRENAWSNAYIALIEIIKQLRN